MNHLHQHGGWAHHLIALITDTGFPELVGGVDAIERGFRGIERAVAVVGVELLAADSAGTPMHEAVFDFENYPHAARLHGFIGDILVMDVPEELWPWAKSVISMGPPPDAPALREALVRHARRPADPLTEMLARFALFEALVLNQRLMLLASGTRLDAVDGRERAVESIADLEVERAMALTAYGNDLVELDDPVMVMVAKALEQLVGDVADLKAELSVASDTVRRQFESRQRINEVLEQLPPADAVLLRNEGGFDGEVLAVDDLQRLHPGLLGGLKRAAIDQRKARALKKAQRIAHGDAGVKSGRTLADLLVAELHGGTR
jgi:hypothetical protein